jgi:hypothetical protein
MPSPVAMLLMLGFVRQTASAVLGDHSEQSVDTIFFVYCFLAIFWSDFPFVAFKRWIKVLGQPIMALIVLESPP